MGRLKDALKPTNIWAGTGYGGSNIGTKTGDTTSSRLLVNSTQLRNSLESRNLYTEFTEYPLQPNDRERVVNSVSSILSVVTPFSSVNLKESVIGRLVSTPTTPLVDIGLIMLGKQFTQNFKSNALQEILPTVNLKNAFDGNADTKLFQNKINYSITEKEGGNNFSEFLDNFFGYRPRKDNIFNTNTTNSEYLQNTGVGQLDFLFGNAATDSSGGLNKNLYKPFDPAYFEAADKSKNNLGSRKITAINKIWFNFSGSKFNRYLSISPSISSEINAQNEMQQAYINSAPVGYNEERNQEYAPDLDYVNEYFGRTNNSELFNIINTLDGRFDDLAETGFNDNINNNLVWGRDGVSDKANERLSQLRGDVDFISQDPQSSFNVQTGLLEYTRNLLNASDGQFVDQTRKIYKRDGRTVGMNGSKLWEAPDSALERFAGEKGVRQHSVLDQYDRFTKAIRFDGNQVYSGNEDSVVYNSVIPRVHPTLGKDGQPDTKNLMFSIENLAVHTIGNDEDNFGIIDDEFGTQIPKSEVGPFDGRIMWFPPYGISLNEVASANYEPTVMVGRNEPIYTYMHSERSATLTFMLIVDYPEQVKNFLKSGNHRDIAEFFAYGGPEYNRESFLNNPQNKEQNNKDKGTEIEGRKDTIIPDITLPENFTISFPNDIPKDGNTDASVIDRLYIKHRYEINDDIESIDGTTNGLNRKIYILSGVTGSEFNPPAGFSQSNAEYIEGKRPFDDALRDLFNDPDNTKFVKIIINGSATALYTESIKGDDEAAAEFNNAIALRRAKVAESFIKARIKKIFPENSNQILNGLVINVNSDGILSQEYDTKESIPLIGAKVERSAEIIFDERDTSPEDKEQKITPNEQQDINTLNEENQRLQGAENKQNKASAIGVMDVREANDTTGEDDGIMKGYQSMINNKFYPAFHSQTPEDFHKRLTFLQQCTRQGSPIRSEPVVDENGITRVKNSVFGRQPICILRIADFFYTKVVIESVTVDYNDTIWDTNPEGFGMQPMIANITVQMKVLGGQSLKGPIDALQNAVSFNYYANSTYTDRGTYTTPSYAAAQQEAYKNGTNVEDFKKNNKDLVGRINSQRDYRDELDNQ